jgi:hypothetical protein
MDADIGLVQTNTISQTEQPREAQYHALLVARHQMGLKQ